MKLLGSITAMVVVLLEVVCPATVAGFVVPVVVDAIDAEVSSTRGGVFGASSHVDEEVLVDVPTLADFDATFSVALELWMVRILTAREHLSPSPVLDTFFSVSSFAVTQIEFGAVTPAAFDAVAAAGFRFSGAQLIRQDDSFIPAVASTKPGRLSAFSQRQESQHQPFPEPRTCQVDQFHDLRLAQKGQDVKMAQRIA